MHVSASEQTVSRPLLKGFEFLPRASLFAIEMVTHVVYGLDTEEARDPILQKGSMSTDLQNTSQFLIMDQFGELRNFLCQLRPGVPFTARSCCLPIPHFEHFEFLKIEYEDWQECCSALSVDWQTTWHGALTPYILNIVYENGFRQPTLVGAANSIGLFHSNNLIFPMKYAYPSPLVLPADDSTSWPENETLYCSMLELKVNPLVKCKGRKWHFTKASDIPNCVHISAVLFGKFQGDRRHKHLQNTHGFIFIRNGVAIDVQSLEPHAYL